MRLAPRSRFSRCVLALLSIASSGCLSPFVIRSRPKHVEAFPPRLECQTAWAAVIDTTWAALNVFWGYRASQEPARGIDLRGAVTSAHIAIAATSAFSAIYGYSAAARCRSELERVMQTDPLGVPASDSGLPWPAPTQPARPGAAGRDGIAPRDVTLSTQPRP